MGGVLRTAYLVLLGPHQVRTPGLVELRLLADELVDVGRVALLGRRWRRHRRLDRRH